MSLTRQEAISALRAAWPWTFLLATGCPLLLDDDFSTLPREGATGGIVGGSDGTGSGSTQAGAAGNLSANPSGEPGAGGEGPMAQGSSGGGPGSGGSSGAPSSGGSSGSTTGSDGSSGSTTGSDGSSGSTTGSGGSSSAASCAGGTTLGPNGHCYRIGTASSSWLNARSECRNLGDGWDLATVLDDRDSAFLSSTMTTEAWIGADDTNGTGVWRWVRDGAEFWQGDSSGSALNDAYVNWNTDEPQGGGGRHCLRISPSALWAAVDCGSGFPPVCEGPSLGGESSSPGR